MKITGNMPIMPVYNNKAKVDRAYGSTEIAGKKDELTISSQAKDFALVMKTLRGVPDVREDKVAELSDALEKGTYNVSGNKISDNLIAVLTGKKI